MTARPFPAVRVLLVLLLLFVPLTAYVAGYLWLGKCWEVGAREGFVNREYRSQWEVDLFKPAGGMEAWWKGKQVVLWSNGD